MLASRSDNRSVIHQVVRSIHGEKVHIAELDISGASGHVGNDVGRDMYGFEAENELSGDFWCDEMDRTVNDVKTKSGQLIGHDCFKRLLHMKWD